MIKDMLHNVLVLNATNRTRTQGRVVALGSYKWCVHQELKRIRRGCLEANAKVLEGTRSRSGDGYKRQEDGEFEKGKHLMLIELCSQLNCDCIVSIVLATCIGMERGQGNY